MNSICSTHFGGCSHSPAVTQLVIPRRPADARGSWAKRLAIRSSSLLRCRPLGRRLGGACEITAAQQIADQMLEIAERTGGSFALAVAHQSQGWSHCPRGGTLIGGAQHFQSSIASFNEADFPADSINPRIGALCGLSVNSWHLGMADTARAQIHEAISSAERMKRPVSLVLPLVIACALYVYLREPENLQKVAERLFTIATEQQIPEYVAIASVYRGWAMAEQGRTRRRRRVDSRFLVDVGQQVCSARVVDRVE